MHLVLLLVLPILLAWLFSSSSTLFVLEVKNGKLSVKKGKPPARIFTEFEEAVKHVRSGAIRGRRSNRGIVLSFRGIDEGTEQRLRNILGIHQT